MVDSLVGQSCFLGSTSAGRLKQATDKPSTMNPPKTAPKDATMILADFGWPWLVPAIWNPTDGKWTVAVMQMSHDGPDYDVWFETDQERDVDLKGWIPYPTKKPGS